MDIIAIEMAARRTRRESEISALRGEGAAAFRQGMDYQSNPHLYADWRHWNAGWHEEKLKMDKPERSSPIASTEEMAEWAHQLMASREPDQVIGVNYLYRWFVIPRNDAGLIYLHKTVGSDDDRALHDHPWDNTSYILRGRYFEHLSDGGIMERVPGHIIQRKATDQHRLTIEPGEECVSLFMTGMWQRVWGFWPEGKFVPWKEFLNLQGKNENGGFG